MNLLALAEQWGEALEQTAVTYLQERCLHTLDKFAACTACQTICPVDAIQFGPPPVFAANVCQQCRACLPVCPVGAYTADDEVDALLKCAAHLNTPTCEVVCGLHPGVGLGDPAATAVRVRGCLAGLGVGAYLGLVNQGFEPVIARMDACADCPWAVLQEQIETQVAQAQDILAGWELDGALVCGLPETVTLQKRPFWNADSPPISRRDLFRWRKDKKHTESQKEMGIGQNNPFRERLRILQAFHKLPPPAHDESLLQGLGFALITVNDDCTACGICARACPTGALQMAADNVSFQLLFTLQACIDCHVCRHFCTPEAIIINPADQYDQIFNGDADQILQAGDLTRCAKCNTPFAARTGARLCPTCEFRRQNRFGTAIPSGLAATLNKKNGSQE